MNRGNTVKQYGFVVRELVSREIKRKYARSYLGILWSVLNPLLMMIVMSAIFSTMFRRSIENYPIYYLTGNIIFQLFSTATNTTMTCLVDNKQMLIKVKFPMQIFPLSRSVTALVNFGYSCIAYAAILIFFRIPLSVTMLFFPVIVAMAKPSRDTIPEEKFLTRSSIKPSNSAKATISSYFSSIYSLV